MARYLIRSLVSALITMLLVSMGLFFLLEVGGGDVSIKILGVFSTEEQRASYRSQLGLDAPSWQRYLDWLVGNDWRAKSDVGLDLITINDESTGEAVWWANTDNGPAHWQMTDGILNVMYRQADGSISTAVPIADSEWQTGDDGSQFFWGVSNNNSAVKWVKGAGEPVWVLTKAGLRQEGDGPRQYIPLRKGLLRGDAGESWQFGRPVAVTLIPRIRNTAVLATVAFAFIMPIALVLGVLAGINEGKFLDRFISITSLTATATPEFVSGIFLILILGIWLKWVPAVAIFTSANAIFEDPTLLILPILTLTAVEVGYVARMTRASMVEVMDSAYVRTAIIKGMPRWRIVFRHALRNALMAPITIIMLHVNYLVGGLVVVEVIFGYPGLGKYIFDAAIFGDFNAIEAATMVTVVIAIATRLIGDLAYTFLNPRVRYS